MKHRQAYLNEIPMALGRPALWTLWAVVFLSTGCRKWEVPRFDDDLPLPNATIGDLCAQYSGGQTVVADNIVVRGRVVSSDLAGNFYRTFFIDDGTGGLEIMAGTDRLSATYHPGQRVAVRAEGLAVGWRDGALQIGLPPGPGSRYPTDYFLSATVLEKYVSVALDVAPVEPMIITMDDLRAALCGRLVRIEGLVADPLLDENATWATAEPKPVAGYVMFFENTPADNAPVGVQDPDGGAPDTGDPRGITVVTSGYASFAGMHVPRGKQVALTGILLHNSDGYLLKLRDLNDVNH